MRVPGLHLVGNGSSNIIEGEMASLPRNLCVEDDLKQQIAKFAFEVAHVRSLDGVGDLVRFFDCVWRDRFECLDGIPFATALGIAKAGHDVEKAVNLFGHNVEVIIYIM